MAHRWKHTGRILADRTCPACGGRLAGWIPTPRSQPGAFAQGTPGQSLLAAPPQGCRCPGHHIHAFTFTLSAGEGCNTVTLSMWPIGSVRIALGPWMRRAVGVCEGLLGSAVRFLMPDVCTSAVEWDSRSGDMHSDGSGAGKTPGHATSVVWLGLGITLVMGSELGCEIRPLGSNPCSVLHVTLNKFNLDGPWFSSSVKRHVITCLLLGVILGIK